MGLQKAGPCVSWDFNSPRCSDLSARGLPPGRVVLQEVSSQQGGVLKGPLESPSHLSSPGSQAAAGTESLHSAGLVLLKALATCKPPTMPPHSTTTWLRPSPPSPMPRGGSGGRVGFHSLAPEPGGGPPAGGRKEGIWRDFRCGCAR